MINSARITYFTGKSCDMHATAAIDTSILGVRSKEAVPSDLSVNGELSRGNYTGSITWLTPAICQRITLKIRDIPWQLRCGKGYPYLSQRR